MTRVLVPVEILEGETVSPGLMTLLGSVDVTVLGYHVLPEQTPPDQARLQYEDRATDALEDLTQEFRSAGGAADYRLVFTHNREKTIERIANEIDASAFAISGITGDVDDILVTLSGDIAVDRILSFVEELVGDRDIAVSLFYASKQKPVTDEKIASAAERLRNHGLTVRTESVVDAPFDALMDTVPGHDAIVIGEKAPSFRSFLFGDEAGRIASASVGPVLVVRNNEMLEE